MEQYNTIMSILPWQHIVYIWQTVHVVKVANVSPTFSGDVVYIVEKDLLCSHDPPHDCNWMQQSAAPNQSLYSSIICYVYITSPDRVAHDTASAFQVQWAPSGEVPLDTVYQQDLTPKYG